MSLDPNHKTARRITGRLFLYASLAIAVLVFYVGVYAYYNGLTDLGNNDRLKINGEVEVKLDGRTIYKDHNTIFTAHYSYIMCKVYNSTTACVAAALVDGDIGSIPNNVLDVAALSTDSTTPVSSSATCSSVITGSGLDKKKADTLTYNSGSNSIQLAWTWTASGTVNNVQKVCLYDRWANNTMVGPWAASTFTAANIQSGQSISVTWTFSY